MRSHDGRSGDRPLEIGRLYDDREPPAALEDRVTSALRDERLIGGDRSRDQLGNGTARTAILGAQPWLSIAAGLLLALGGFGLGRFGLPAPTGSPGYVLLLWEDEAFGSDVAAETFAEEYAAWAETVSDRGVAISGSELAPARRFAGTPRPSRLTPESQSAQLGGYFLVASDSEAVVLQLAEGHPHVAHGGWIEVAQLIGRGGGP